MKKKKDTVFEGLFSAAGIAFFAVVLLFSFFAVKRTSADYLTLKEHDLSEDAYLTISYDDRIYASLGSGIEIDHRDSEAETLMRDFLVASLQSIDRRILYTMMAVTLLAFPLYRRFGQAPRRHVCAVACSVPILFAVFWGPFSSCTQPSSCRFTSRREQSGC